ncbi:unnamed protein product [Caenorhabditis brenneri]
MQRIFSPFDALQKSSRSIVCIWLNGEPTAIGIRAQKIWNRAEYRVSTDGGVNEIFRRNEDVEWPHVVCGDFDSIDKTIDLRSAEKVALPDQDHTDLTKTIKWCLEQKSNAKWSFNKLVVLGGLNGRFDHTMSTLSSLLHFIDQSTEIIVIDSNNMVVAVPEGESKINIELEMTSRMCGVIPIAQKTTVVTSNGLKYEMADHLLAFGVCVSSSNEVISNQITLNTTAPLIFTIELNQKS